MDCQDLLDKLYLLMDDELEEGQCAEMRAHMERCGPCLERLAVEERFKQMVSDKCGERGAPETLMYRIRIALQSEAGD